MAKAKPKGRPKQPVARVVHFVMPPLGPKDRKALDALVARVNRVAGLFTGNRFVFRDSVVVLGDKP